jgi:ATPase family associated with various cellular activities (AAA)
VEEERVRALLAEAAANLRLPLYEWSLTHGLSRLGQQPIGSTQDPLAALRHISGLACEAVFLLKDLSRHLENAGVARELRDLAEKLTSTRSAIALTGDPLDLPPDISGMAVRYPLRLPGQDELRDTVRSVVDTLSARQPVRVDLARGDIERIVTALSGLTLNQARQVVARAILQDGRLAADDVTEIIRSKGEMISHEGLLEFYPPESNRWELGGFAGLKKWLAEARIGFSPQARALNLAPPRGLLLVGVQGCGKSLGAKFIAREWSLPLLKLDAGRLYDKFVGESEKRFSRATALAEAMAPVVLWIDEIEKAFASGASDSADGGLSQRLFGFFLTWLQEKSAEVFVVGAANDLMRLPPELLRKGRFDEIFFVDLPDAGERQEILRIHLALRKNDPAGFDLAALAAASEGFSGAEIEQGIVAAMYRALSHGQTLTTEAILAALKATVPLSVTRREDIEQLRREAQGRFAMVK